jgi:hypothetical protein
MTDGADGVRGGGTDRPRASPTLSLVIPTRQPWSHFGDRFASLLEEMRDVGGEVVVLAGPGVEVDDGTLRVMTTSEQNLLSLRARAACAARGPIVALAEDHAVPVPGWSHAVLRAHDEHPAAAGIVGCLLNTADDTVAGRANFLAFAAPYAPPMPAVPSWRPPPLSAVSFKRDALAGLDDRPGGLENVLVPRLFRDGRLVADDRVRVMHHQVCSSVWSVRNSYWSTRAAYGYAEDRHDPQRRREIISWVVTNMPQMVWREAHAAHRPVRGGYGELAIAASYAAAGAIGAVVGTLAGPGTAPYRTE